MQTTMTIREISKETGLSPLMVRWLIESGEFGTVKKGKERSTFIVFRGEYEEWAKKKGLKK